MRKIGKIVLLSTSILFSGAITPYTPYSLEKAEASSTLKLVSTSYQTTGNVNMRSGPSTKNPIVVMIPKGKTITAFEQTGNWYKISYQYSVKGKKVTKIGWISGSYIKKIAVPHSSPKTVKFPKTTYQTTASLNMRSGAGTNYKSLLAIPKGKTVTSTEKAGTWFKVVYTYSYKGKNVTLTGWVSGNYVKEYYKNSTIASAYYFTKKTVYLYATPDKKKKAVFSIGSGNGFSSSNQVVNSIGQTWYKVSFNGKTLYIYSGDVSKYAASSFAKTDYQSKVDTYLYSSYGNAFIKMMKIPKDAFISVSQKIGDWFKVAYNGKSGYVYTGDFSKYSMPSEEKMNDEAAYVVVTDGQFRVYPDQSSSLLATLPKGTKVTPSAKMSNGWYKITYNGETGYMNELNLQKVVEVPPTPPTQDDSTEVTIEKATYLVSENLNLRQKGDSSSTILATIPKGTIVIPTSMTSDKWYKVAYDGKTGYVYGTYIQKVTTGDPMGNRDSYQFIDLRTQSSVTADQINNYIAGYVKSTGKTSILNGKGQAFIDAGKKYGVNALYLAAHAIHESAYGTSAISIAKNNLFGFGAYDAAPFMAAYRFTSVDLCIDYIASEIKATYLNPTNWKFKGAYLGFSTKTLSGTRINENSEGMNFFYASDAKWGNSIAQHMENILHYDKSYYAKAEVNMVVPTRPAIPDGSDLFPKGTVAVSKDSNIGIPKGESFFLLEKTNDYRLRVNYAGKEFWINTIKFSSYFNFLSVQNLGRVTTAKLNVRSDPSTSKAAIATLSLNDYVQIVLQKDGTLTKDPSKAWYQVILANGTTGWVSASYIYSKDFK